MGVFSVRFWFCAGVIATPGTSAMNVASGVGVARAMGVGAPQLWVTIAQVAMLFVASQGIWSARRGLFSWVCHPAMGGDCTIWMVSPVF